MLLLALLGACAAPSARATPPLLLDHVTVIDGRGGPALPDRAVLIEGERIVGILPGGTGDIPEGTRRIDLPGRFLIPGLIDSHVHLKSRPRDAGFVERVLADHFLASGVTTVRDMGGNGAELLPLARGAEAPDADSPRILLSSLFTGSASDFWMSGPQAAYVSAGAAPGSQPWFRRLGGGDLETAVAQARAWGASGIKLHSGFTGEEVRRLGEAARRHGLRLWGHGEAGTARPSDLVAAGAASISHADMVAYEGLTERPAGFERLTYRDRTLTAMRATPVEGPVLGRLFALMREQGTCLEPTLYVMGASEPAPGMGDYIAYAAAATSRAQREGVAICAGTDAIRGSTATLIEELELLVRLSGLTPQQALTAATHNNARALGLADRGLIAAGMTADLVILAQDPLSSIGNLRSVEAVITRGLYRPRRPQQP